MLKCEWSTIRSSEECIYRTWSTLAYSQPGWPEDLKNNFPNIQKVSQKVSKANKTKISTTKLNLKTQNIYIKLLLKPKNICIKPCFETAYLGENVINLLHQKLAQNIAISFGLIHLFKKSQWASKSSPIGKKLPNLVTLLPTVDNRQKCFIEFGSDDNFVLQSKKRKTEAYFLFVLSIA